MPAAERVPAPRTPGLLAIVGRPVFAHAEVPFGRCDERPASVVRARRYVSILTVSIGRTAPCWARALAAVPPFASGTLRSPGEGHACKVRVRYEANQYPVPSVHGGGGDYLRDGEEYVVIEVGMDPLRRVWFRIENQDGTPALYDSRCFTEVDRSLPTHWTARLTDHGSVTFGPPEFLEAGFWERYFDRVADAVDLYHSVQSRDRS
jgi:hypothetical protein